MSTVLRRSLLALAIVTGFVPAAEAQFETTNRAFHNRTAFPLDGRHRDVPCESCHLQGAYKGTPSRCFDCHWTRRQDDRYRLQLGSQCEQCHRSTSWTAVRWDHAVTGNPLTAAHRTLQCEACHQPTDLRAALAPCVACHQQDYNATRTPNHAAAGFPTTCEICHTPSHTSFQQATFTHTAFPLVGVHSLQACATCHRNNVYAGTPRTCVGCHRAEYDRTTSPNHAAAGFPTACESCHRPTDASFSSGTGFNHNAVFALVGRHGQAICTECHVNNVYRGTPRTCVGCHRTDYERTTAPNHAAAGFPTACESCHRPTDPSFRGGGGFSHAAVFPLVGQHAQATCTACHVNNTYRGTSRDCVGCHREQYDRTTSPNHAATGFSTGCQSCHRATDNSWQQGSFNHRFPITSGPHRQSCSTCHQAGTSSQTFTCVVCHEHSRARMDDKHKERSGYRYESLACYGCHPTGRH